MNNHKTRKFGSNMALALASAMTLLSVVSPAIAQESVNDVRNAVQQAIGSRGVVLDIKASPMEGVYEINVSGRTAYASKVGKHVIIGDVYDTEKRVSLADEKKQERALATLNTMPESEMIVFGDDSAKRTMTVYTDVDCGYCQKLHKEVPALVAGGVKVRYLWYPRAGIGSGSYKKAVSVWCSPDQQQAMDNAKLKRSFTNETCDPNPVAAQFKSGQQVGVRGTPTIVLDDGTIIGGYMPAKSLLTNLGLGS